MNRFGTAYGGWNLPTDVELSGNSIVYSAGVGEDISFDILLQARYDPHIFLIDPTLRAVKHFDEVRNFYSSGVPLFTGDIQKNYVNVIGLAKPKFEKIVYLEKGLWNKRDTLKFYKPVNEKYVSHTLIKDMYSPNYENVEVDAIKNIMDSHGHVAIDVLKLDIEGAEIAVLNQMLDDAVFPKYICVEFDLKLKGVDIDDQTGALIQRLEKHYEMLENRGWNCLFKKIS